MCPVALGTVERSLKPKIVPPAPGRGAGAYTGFKRQGPTAAYPVWTYTDRCRGTKFGGCMRGFRSIAFRAFPVSKGF